MSLIQNPTTTGKIPGFQQYSDTNTNDQPFNFGQADQNTQFFNPITPAPPGGYSYNAMNIGTGGAGQGNMTGADDGGNPYAVGGSNPNFSSTFGQDGSGLGASGTGVGAGTSGGVNGSNISGGPNGSSATYGDDWLKQAAGTGSGSGMSASDAQRILATGNGTPQQLAAANQAYYGTNGTGGTYQPSQPSVVNYGNTRGQGAPTVFGNDGNNMGLPAFMTPQSVTNGVPNFGPNADPSLTFDWNYWQSQNAGATPTNNLINNFGWDPFKTMGLANQYGYSQLSNALMQNPPAAVNAPGLGAGGVPGLPNSPSTGGSNVTQDPNYYANLVQQAMKTGFQPTMASQLGNQQAQDFLTPRGGFSVPSQNFYGTIPDYTGGGTDPQAQNFPKAYAAAQDPSSAFFANRVNVPNQPGNPIVYNPDGSVNTSPGTFDKSGIPGGGSIGGGSGSGTNNGGGLSLGGNATDQPAQPVGGNLNTTPQNPNNLNQSQQQQIVQFLQGLFNGGSNSGYNSAGNPFGSNPFAYMTGQSGSPMSSLSDISSIFGGGVNNPLASSNSGGMQGISQLLNVLNLIQLLGNGGGSGNSGNITRNIQSQNNPTNGLTYVPPWDSTKNQFASVG